MVARPSRDRQLTVVLAPDSFKGSLPAEQVAEALADGWRRARPRDRVVELPMADGGEGTLNAAEAAVPGAERHTVPGATGPDGRPVDAHWLALPDGSALVELADVSGLPLMLRPDPLGATTRGLGQVLAAACRPPTTRLLIALGGSATSDGATGALRELGLQLLDDADLPLSDGGGALQRLAYLDRSQLHPPPPGGVELLSDVDNPLLGAQGAAAVFGPQKGADASQMRELEAGLGRLAEVSGGDPDAPGAGAAGGAGYGFATFWGASSRPGSQVIAELIGLADHLEEADLLITGEGTVDPTSLGGKVVGHLLGLARHHALPTAVVAGIVTAVPEAARRTLSTSELAGDPARSLAEPRRWLCEAGYELACGAAAFVY